ncbi:VWA domain-containing protein [Paractinoplanes globisporus]|uniref:VWA domain-containing protein n=1 Tax=Paractinoplanes globisporus TaxID=113565 RepID=A0ABW6W8R8_9ACTN|nr:VWA domain-containing protein [Actinoplanes globisporus]
MAKHRARGALRWEWPALALLALAGLVLAGVLVAAARSGDTGTVAGDSCGRPVRVVAASSYTPVLAALTLGLPPDDCLRLEVTAADGRAAAKRAGDVNADLWIADDSSWAASAGSVSLAQAPALGAGTVLATSPIYMVTDPATGARLKKAGAGWLGLAGLVREKTARLVVRDPGGSGDGLVGAGAVAEAVWLDKDMDASALWLADAKRTTRTVIGDDPAIPAKGGEVGLVPEYVLLRDPEAAQNRTVLPGTDHTALLRYTWLPLAAAAADPARAAALERLRTRLTNNDAAADLRAARLRTPDTRRVVSGEDLLPPPTAEPFGVLAPHHVDHVFATWYAGDRRTNLLVVVDVSGSMAAPAVGSTSSRIELVRQGCRSVAGLLPDDSRMGLWEFGSELDGGRDYRSLLAMTPLTPQHRSALAGAVTELNSRKTGTGLYDTILAAYTSARDAYQADVPNQVLVLTDGRNESDKKSLTAAQLSAALQKVADKNRPVQLSVVTFGTAADAKVVNDAVEPVGGYVDNLSTATEVAAVFIHVAAGGLHH